MKMVHIAASSFQTLCKLRDVTLPQTPAAYTLAGTHGLWVEKPNESLQPAKPAHAITV